MPVNDPLIKALFDHSNQAQHALFHVIIDNTDGELDEQLISIFAVIGQVTAAAEHALNVGSVQNRAVFKEAYVKQKMMGSDEALREHIAKSRKAHRRATDAANEVISTLFKKASTNGN